MKSQFIQADCLEWMKSQRTNSVDLIFCSPPYEAARTYGIDFSLKGQAWVDWCVERFIESIRISRGLVAWVVEGQTRNYQWSATPALLMADLHRKGINLRKPPVYYRDGIPGSGGPDWLRNQYEFIICGTKGGQLVWSDNTAMGHPPKYGPGGFPTHRLTSGERANEAKMRRLLEKNPKLSQREAARQSGTRFKHTTSGIKKGERTDTQLVYVPPEKANPGNVVKCAVGWGKMGHPLAHENEAPFPETLAEFFIRSFCKPNGTVLDIFSGSGTTVAVALKCGRSGIGIDIRDSQVKLGRKRVRA